MAQQVGVWSHFDNGTHAKADHKALVGSANIAAGQPQKQATHIDQAYC